jgi:uncharacterized protein YjbI with pentapeptide repeats
MAVLLVLGPGVAKTHAEQGAFRHDPLTGKCLDSQGREGLNPGGSGDDLRRGKAVAECVDFTKARTNMTYLSLTGANLRGANLDGAMFYLGAFTDSDFRGANLDGTTGQVDYSRTDLRGASFRGADLTYSTFDGALLEGARFDDGTRLPFSRADAEARGMRFVPSGR